MRFNTSGAVVEFSDYLKTWKVLADDLDRDENDEGSDDAARYANNTGGGESAPKRQRDSSCYVETLIAGVSSLLAVQNAEKAREKWIEQRLLPLLEEETDSDNIRALVLSAEEAADSEDFEKPIEVLTNVLNNLKCAETKHNRAQADVGVAIAKAEATLVAVRNDASSPLTAETSARARGKSPMPDPLQHLAGPSCTSTASSPTSK